MSKPYVPMDTLHAQLSVSMSVYLTTEIRQGKNICRIRDHHASSSQPSFISNSSYISHEMATFAEYRKHL